MTNDLNESLRLNEVNNLLITLNKSYWSLVGSGKPQKNNNAKDTKPTEVIERKNEEVVIVFRSIKEN